MHLASIQLPNGLLVCRRSKGKASKANRTKAQQRLGVRRAGSMLATVHVQATPRLGTDTSDRSR